VLLSQLRGYMTKAEFTTLKESQSGNPLAGNKHAYKIQSVLLGPPA